MLLIYFIAAAALPYLLAWALTWLPSQSAKEASFVTGNALSRAPLSPTTAEPASSLLSVSRLLNSKDFQPYLTGARHLPVTTTAPLLQRTIQSPDPALQLYAQSQFQRGKAELLDWQKSLHPLVAQHPRYLSWYVEVSLQLAHRSLCTESDRSKALIHLAQLISQTLPQLPAPSPALLQQLIHTYLQAQQPQLAQQLLTQLPSDHPEHSSMTVAVTRALQYSPSTSLVRP
jgi:hypothetical protein